MKNDKLQAIFSEYLEWLQKDTDSGRFWKAADKFHIGITQLDTLQSTAVRRPGGKFCVSVFRQNQEYHIINVHD